MQSNVFKSLLAFYLAHDKYHMLHASMSSPGAPTNIYIQGLDSVGQLSSELRLMKEENVSLQNQLKQATRGTVCCPLPGPRPVEKSITFIQQIQSF